MNSKEKARLRLLTDFPFYAEHVLKIKTKSKGVQPFILNEAQRYIHDIVEKQLKDLGYVRVLILKGRQQGCSTFVGGRFYFKTSQNFAKNALVMAHDSNTTNMLFGITRMYHDKCPEDVRPSTRAASAKEFDFDELDSGYRVSTAGSGEGGRGGTVHYLHGSEVAFWKNADLLFAGIMQSVPSGEDIFGSEIFLESTANGPSGKFYELWMDAEKGNNEYIPIFTPWYWQDEYSVSINTGDTPKWTEDEIKYQESYGITDGQLLWRRYKISELGESKFKQEYPATAQEAFEYSEEGAFFDREKVTKCAEDKDLTKAHIGAKVGALDPSGGGANGDRTAIGYGDDIAIREVKYLKGLDPYQLAKAAEDYIQVHDLDKMRVDVIGVGAGVYAILKRGRYAHLIEAFIASGTTSTMIDGKEVYGNRRAEAYGRFRDWIGDGTVHQIPNDPELINDICAPLETTHATNGKTIAESKKDMRERGVKSPDGLDVCAMIKCETVRPRNYLTNDGQYDMVMETANYDVLNFGLD